MLDPDELLSTTRAVRRRLDLTRPVPDALLLECLELALQAPSGSNRQGWHFVLVTDADLRAGLAGLYAQAFARYEERIAAAAVAPDAATARVHDSARYLAEHLAEVPVHLVACAEGRPEGRQASSLAAYYGSVLPAVWSFCLARSRGLGTALATMHLSYEREAAELLGIPYDEVAQVALVPVGYLLGGELRRAPRRDLSRALHRDRF